MSDKSEAKHHYVPAGLVGRWTFQPKPHKPERERPVYCWVKGKGKGRPDTVSPQQICQRRALYTLLEEPDAIDQGLRYLILDSIFERGLPDEGDRAWLSDEHLRWLGESPAARDTYPPDFVEDKIITAPEKKFLDNSSEVVNSSDPRRINVELTRKFISSLLLRHPRWLDDDVNGHKASWNPVLQPIWVAQIVNPARFERVLRGVSVALMLENWMKAPWGEDMSSGRPGDITLLVAEGQSRFVLSDNPAHLWVLSPHGPVFPKRSRGLNGRDALITMPISPRHCLLWSMPGRSGLVPAKDSLVRAINTATATHAVHHVILPGEGEDYFLPGFDLRRCPPWQGWQA